MTFSYHKRPGWVCYYCRWNAAGKVIEQKWRPPLREAEPSLPSPDKPQRRDRVRRGAVAEVQGSLL